METLVTTIKANGLLDRIITTVSIQQAEDICERRNLHSRAFAVRAMWYTGSTGCCVSKELVSALGLKCISLLELTSAHGSKRAKVYLVDIVFPDNTIAKNVIAAEIIPSSSFDFIIGMNIIRHGDFAISNDNGKTVMSFRLPSANKAIDFSNESDTL
jgi:hypothetical protein